MNTKAKESVRDYYHGTSAGLFPKIIGEGLRPCLGAGANALSFHYGMPVPGVYVAPSWRIASQYPIMPTTGNVSKPGPNTSSQLSGGTIIA